MRKLLAHMIGAGLGLWLATLLVVGVALHPAPDSSFFGISLTETWKFFVLFGVVLGLLTYFVKPLLDVITLPLRIITLGLFTIVTTMAIIWVVDVIFTELSIPPLYPLLWTSLIVWGLQQVIYTVLKKES